jgi:CheY-like chemotaxis protein
MAHKEFLILDDSEDTITVLEQLLKLGGANVTTATDGAEALRLASEETPTPSTALQIFWQSAARTCERELKFQ